jgi:SPOR domain
MARSNGPFGPPERPPQRDPLATLQVRQPATQWPTQTYPDHGQPVQAGPAYHFPPQEPPADFGYNQQFGNQQFAPPQQQWGQPGDQGGYGVASYLPADAPSFQQTAHSQQAYDQQAYTEPDYADEFYEDEEPRRGRRWLLVMVALVGAIGVGGALAYTYKSLIAPGGGRVPLVKAIDQPNSVKVRPEQRGGKEFAGSDAKLPNPTGAAPTAPPQQEPESSDAPNREPRKVKPIPIGPQQASASQPVSASIPGITLHNNQQARPRAEEPEAAPKPPPAAARVTTSSPPPAPAEAPERSDPPAPPPPEAKPQPSLAVAPPPQPPQQVAAARPSPQKATAPPPASSAAVYVVVLASKKTRMDAVQAYADAHEKYAQMLSGKAPEVQEADLGEKGITYRAVVGPPASREAAASLCGQLKAAGQDCWIKAY